MSTVTILSDASQLAHWRLYKSVISLTGYDKKICCGCSSIDQDISIFMDGDQTSLVSGTDTWTRTYDEVTQTESCTLYYRSNYDITEIYVHAWKPIESVSGADILQLSAYSSREALYAAARSYFDSQSTKPLYVGVNGKAREVTDMYVGVNGRARKVTAIYVGVNGRAREVFKAT